MPPSPREAGASPDLFDTSKPVEKTKNPQFPDKSKRTPVPPLSMDKLIKATPINKTADKEKDETKNKLPDKKPSRLFLTNRLTSGQRKTEAIDASQSSNPNLSHRKLKPSQS